MKIFRDNIWLSVAATVLMFCLGLIVWRYSLHIARLSQEGNSINILTAMDSAMIDKRDDADCSEIVDSDKVYVSLQAENVYLCDTQGNQIFGPCKSIFLEREYYDDSRIFYYIDMNGLSGYGKVQNIEISIISQGIYSEASRMLDGSACVKESDEYYYIDRAGKRFTVGQYLNAYPFSESQGSYARVQKMDGSWSVINRKEEELLSGFESIDELSYCTYIGTGIRDGKVVIFTLEQNEDQQPCIIRELEEFTKVVRYVGIDYIVVMSNDGKQGVVDIWNGEIIVPANYEDIQWVYMDIGEKKSTEIVCFQCQKADGSYDIYYGK